MLIYWQYENSHFLYKFYKIKNFNVISLIFSQDRKTPFPLVEYICFETKDNGNKQCFRMYVCLSLTVYHCAPLVADLFLFCYERDFMKSLTKEKRYDLIDAFNSTSRYLDDLLNIDNIHFEHIWFTEYIPLNFN